MTKRERVEAVFNHQIPDRIPVMMHNFQMAAQEAGFSMQEYRSSSDHMSQALIQSCIKYDLDGIFLDIDTALLAGACGADVKFPENIAAVTADFQPRSIEQIIEDVKKVNLRNDPRVQIYLDTIRKLSIWCKENDVFLRGNADQGPYSLACLLVGMNEFLVSLLDEDCEDDLLELIKETYRISYEMQLLCKEAGADCTSYGNSSEGCSVVSPAIFRKFGKPSEIKLARALEEANIKTLCHICGSVVPILSDFAEIGAPGYEIDAKTDIYAAKEAATGHFIISGNLDPSMLSTGHPDEIRAKTKELCDLFRGQGGFILCSGCALSPFTPPENIHAVVETVKKFG